MPKNALVLDDHFGDDGFVQAGQILHDVTAKRFEILEKKNLVREATADEVETGDQIAFEKDNSAALSPAAEETAEERADDKAGGEKQAPEPDNKQAPAPKTKSA